MKSLDDKTWVPLGLAVLVIGSASAWTTKVHVEVEAQAKMIDATKQEHKDDMKAIRDSLETIAKELAGVKGELSRIQ